MNGLRVVSCSGTVLVVDGGSRAAAADDRALAMTNAAVANPWSTSGLEILLGPCVLEAVGEVVVAVCDVGDGDIIRSVAGDVAVSAFQPITLHAGDQLRVGRASRGLRRLVAVRGGVTTAATNTPVAGAVLPVAAEVPGPRAETPSETTPTAPTTTTTLRIVAGGERGLFDDDGWHQLLATLWRVSPVSNRRGVRLDGDGLALSAATTAAMAAFVTTPMWTGAVQVTPSGQPVILGADSRTTGGYPRLAQVVAVDRWRLGQLRPGAVVTFTAITLDDARALHRAWEARWQPRV